MGQDPVTGKYVAVPEATEFDIIQTRFRHRHHRVRVRIQFVSLPPGVWTNLYLRGKTSAGARFNVEVLKSLGLKHVQAGVLSKGRACDRPVHYTFDYAQDVAVIGFARACLGWPHWVQVGAWVTGAKEPDTVEDDASREQVVHKQLGHPIVSPRRLTRGTW